MSSPASFKGHPLHPVLVDLPIGLWVFSFVADIIRLVGWGGPVWSDVALYTMGGGVIGGLIAAVPGLIDLLSLRDPQVKSIGIWHMTTNLVIVAIFIADFWWRLQGAGGIGPVVVSAVAIALLGLSGWLGGEMVFGHGVGVKPHSGTD